MNFHQVNLDTVNHIYDDFLRENYSSRSVLNKWMNILNDEYDIDEFSIEKFLSSERLKLQWLTEGLSSDQLSIQNAIILLNTKLCPVVIDPSSEAIKWFTEHLKNKTVERITQNSSKFITSLELAIRFGKLLIIEEIDTILPVLYPIVRKEFSVQGQRRLIGINGKLIDYHENFSLVFVTRNTQLKLPVDIKSSVNLIKFVTAQEGLEEQLLNSVIQKISPELEKRKKELLYQQEELQEKQIQLQDQLLEDLNNSSGDILQNKELIVSLNKTKSGSDAIVKALEESKKIQEIMQAEYDVYKDISNFGSFLYFSATDFSKINALYSLSIRSFTRLFLNTLPPFEEDEYDLKLAKSTLVQAFYNYMSRGVFKKDRLTFALFLTHKLFPNEVPEEQWEIFLGKTTVKKGIDHDDVPQWIPKHLSQNVISLQLLSDFYKLLRLDDQKLWENFVHNTDCENYFPQHLLKCTDFEKVLLVQCLKPDRLLTVLTSFIFRLTGLRSLHPEILQFSKIFNESVEQEPILVITSSGNDPSAELKSLAEKTIGSQKYIEISMGEDEKDAVLITLLEAAKLGNWLSLKNLHLVTSWLPVLCQNLQNIEFHKDFRLWLVTEYHKQFNPVLAQNCLKVVFEAPQGIKNNILRSFSKWGPAYLNKLNPTGSRIFFILTCIHALLQERRTYIPQGWSKWYEFSDSDLSTAVRLAEEIWKSQTIALVWKYLYGLCTDAIYGSRIEKHEDRKILKAYLKQYLNDECLSHRWRPLGLNVSLPSSSNYDDYIKSIQHLNNRDLAIYFGLPENIEKALEKNTSHHVLEKLKDLYIGGSAASTSDILAKTNINNWQKFLVPYMSLWKKLNQNHSFVKENPDTLGCEGGNPLEVFIGEEYKNGIVLLQTIHKSLSALNSVLKGNCAPNDEDKRIVNDLQKHKTPVSWLKTWKGSEDPQDYMKNVVRKVRKLLDWKNTKPIEKFFALSIDLSYTFHPEGFFAAFKQYHARKNKIPLDELYMKTTFTPIPDRESIILTGLLLEGGLFNGRKLIMCDFNSNNLNASPDCQLSWETKASKLDSYEYLNVPLYTSKRERLLTFLHVPCEPKEKEIWITAALAFFIDF